MLHINQGSFQYFASVGWSRELVLHPDPHKQPGGGSTASGRAQLAPRRLKGHQEGLANPHPHPHHHPQPHPHPHPHPNPKPNPNPDQVNPALAHGMAHAVGTVEPGKLADLVLWKCAHISPYISPYNSPYISPYLVLWKCALPSWSPAATHP